VLMKESRMNRIEKGLEELILRICCKSR
jgi:hypothetical protein